MTRTMQRPTLVDLSVDEPPVIFTAAQPAPVPAARNPSAQLVGPARAGSRGRHVDARAHRRSDLVLVWLVAAVLALMALSSLATHVIDARVQGIGSGGGTAAPAQGASAATESGAWVR